jgi:sulfonate transport system ATP-binding protein
MSLAIQVQGAVKAFGPRRLLEGLNLHVERGEFVALLGESGSGKTTLLRVLTGLEGLDRGTAAVVERRAVVFQEPRLVVNLRVLDNVLLGRGDSRENRARAARLLDEVGLAGLRDAWPGTLSGGEAQRVALARALLTEPELLLLDEPFASLDALTRIRMHELVAELCVRHGPAVLLVTHDVDEAILLADRVLVLTSGTLRTDVEVEIARPRARGTAEFTALRRRLLGELGVVERA